MSVALFWGLSQKSFSQRFGAIDSLISRGLYDLISDRITIFGIKRSQEAYLYLTMQLVPEMTIKQSISKHIKFVATAQQIRNIRNLKAAKNGELAPWDHQLPIIAYDSKHKHCRWQRQIDCGQQMAYKGTYLSRIITITHQNQVGKDNADAKQSLEWIGKQKMLSW